MCGPADLVEHLGRELQVRPSAWQGFTGGRLKATPLASDPRWELGRTGHTVIEGRWKVQRGGGARVANEFLMVS
jgi:hypothetical protein